MKSVQRFADRWWLAIVAAGFLLRLLVALTVPVFPIVANTWDATYYHETARSLSEGRGFSFQGHPTALYPPGYPAFLSVAYAAFGDSARAGQVLNVFASVLLLAGAAWLAAETLGKRGAAATACVLAVEPSQIVFPAFLMSEGVTGALLAVALAALVRFLKRGGFGWLLVAALLASCSGMTRAHAFLVLPCVLLAMFVLRSAMRRRLVLALAVVALAHAAVVGAWAARNQRLLGSPVLVATNGSMNLLLGNNPNANGGRADPPGGVPDTGDEIADERESRSRAIAYIREHPGRFVGLMPAKAARLLLPAPAATYRAELREKWGALPAMGTVGIAEASHVLLAITFLAWGWKRRRTGAPGERLLLVVAVATLVAWTLGHLPFLGGARYFFPVQFLLAAGIGAEVSDNAT